MGRDIARDEQGNGWIVGILSVLMLVGIFVYVVGHFSSDVNFKYDKTGRGVLSAHTDGNAN